VPFPASWVQSHFSHTVAQFRAGLYRIAGSLYDGQLLPALYGTIHQIVSSCRAKFQTLVLVAFCFVGNNPQQEKRHPAAQRD